MKILKITFLIILFFITGCSSTSSVHVWIDVPINNLHLSSTQEIKIEGHAASPEGVTLIEVFVNGELIDSISPVTTSSFLTSFETTYTPTSPGMYIIHVVATNTEDNESTPDTATVLIEEMAWSKTNRNVLYFVIADTTVRDLWKCEGFI